MSPTPAPFLYINGWPGVGKLAVAECLSLLLGRDKALLVNAGELHAGYRRWDLHDQEENPGDELTRLLSGSSSLRRLAILTDCTPDTPAGRTTAATYAAAASRAGRLFVPVCLECQPAEHRQRIQSLERRCSLRGKKCFHDGMDCSANGCKLTFQAGVGHELGPKHGDHGTAAAMTLDVTNMEALEAAVRVLEYVNDKVARFEEAWCCGSAMPTPMEEGKEWRM
ncbi:hypothetical protein GQ53DRAFT_771590 [Thozetella sp. PMI_491]|nr:hypothetical protein GQ53DRAFT_771590 [Thozetella sp. PMI_491]